jgi:hypothetical protein
MEGTTLPSPTDYVRQNPASAAQSAHRLRAKPPGQRARWTDHFQEDRTTDIQDRQIHFATRSSSTTSLVLMLASTLIMPSTRMDFKIGPGHQHAGQRVRDRRSTPRKAISGCVVGNTDISTRLLETSGLPVNRKWHSKTIGFCLSSIA